MIVQVTLCDIRSMYEAATRLVWGGDNLGAVPIGVPPSLAWPNPYKGLRWGVGGHMDIKTKVWLAKNSTRPHCSKPDGRK